MVLQTFDAASFDILLLEKLDQNRERVAADGGFEATVHAVIKASVRERWFCPLLHELKQARPQLAGELDVLVRECCMENHWYVADNPIDTHYVGSFPFIDRVRTRQLLRQFFTDPLTKVLVVKGATHAGKSYLWNLIQHLVQHLVGGDTLLYDPSVENPIPPGCSALDLADAIAKPLGLGSCFQLDMEAQGSRRALWLSRWLHGEFRERRGPYYVVIDGLDEAIMTEDAHELIQHLARTATRGGAPLHLLLLGYERELPSDVALYVLFDEIEAIGEAEVEAFFQEVGRLQGKPLTPDAAKLAARQVFDAVDDPRRLHERVRETADRIFGPEGTP